MNIYEFMSQSPYLTFFLVVIICCTITEVAKYMYLALKAWLA